MWCEHVAKSAIPLVMQCCNMPLLIVNSVRFWPKLQGCSAQGSFRAHYGICEMIIEAMYGMHLFTVLNGSLMKAE